MRFQSIFAVRSDQNMGFFLLDQTIDTFPDLVPCKSVGGFYVYTYPSYRLNISVQPEMTTPRERWKVNMATKYMYFRVKSSHLLRTLEPLFSKQTLLLKENT